MQDASQTSLKGVAMSPRFITNLVVLLAGGFVAVASQIFGTQTTAWIAFGVALGTLGVIAVAQRSAMRSDVQSVLDLMMGALAIWSAVASMIFSGSLLMWLSFGDALGLVALAIGGLVAHELSTEHMVHTLTAEDRGDSTVKATKRISAAA
jgi:hypothetical protein